jgi:ferredoxin--NADP+ reductase
LASKNVDYNATIIHMELLTPTLAIFRVKGDTPMESFIPGQYAILGLNHPEKGGVMRAYSIASAPYLHADYLEFYIRYVNEPTSDNPLTHLLFKVKQGDRILMRPKIQGHFTEEKTMGVSDPRLKVLVASGTGLAPFTSMVFEKHHNTGNANGYAIVHGASYPNDLGYVEELESILNKGAAKRYLPSISRPKEAPDWKGLTGRIESHFEPGKIEKLEKAMGMALGDFNPKNVTIMICGLQGTIANTITNLLHRGFVPGDKKIRRTFGIPDDVPASLYYEQYDATPIIDPKDEALVDECIARLRKHGIAAEKKAAEA